MAMLQRGTSRFILSLVCALSIAGCKKPIEKATIDSSSQEAFRISVVKLAESLPPETRPQFHQAMAVVTMRGFVQVSKLYPSESREVLAEQARKLLDGKGAEEIIRMGDQVRVENKAPLHAVSKMEGPSSSAVPLQSEPAAVPAAAPSPVQAPRS